MTNFDGLLSVLSIFFCLAIISIVLYLQVKLSTKDNKYLGLILPFVSFAMAAMMTYGFSSFNGIIYPVENTRSVMNKPEVIPIILLLLVTNIPTAILSGIYYSERSKKKIRKEIEKMRIEDL